MSCINFNQIEHKKWYTIRVCLLVSLTIGSAVFINRPDCLCLLWTPNVPRTACYISIGSVAAGFTGATCALFWKLLPRFAKAYLSLLAIATTRDVTYWVCFTQLLVILIYILHHLFTLLIIPFKVVKCFKEGKLNFEAAGVDTAKITTLLEELRFRLGNWISGAIRMRMGIWFDLKITSEVADALGKIWTLFQVVLDRCWTTLNIILKILHYFLSSTISS